MCLSDSTATQPYIDIRLDPIPIHKLSTTISKLPHTIIVSQPLLQHVVTYRKIVAEVLLKKPSASQPLISYEFDESFMSPVCDIVLKYFPMIIDDPDINYTFLNLWNERKAMERKSRKVRHENFNFLFCSP